jgi:hypothetical protein
MNSTKNQFYNITNNNTKKLTQKIINNTKENNNIKHKKVLMVLEI